MGFMLKILIFCRCIVINIEESDVIYENENLINKNVI